MCRPANTAVHDRPYMDVKLKLWTAEVGHKTSDIDIDILLRCDFEALRHLVSQSTWCQASYPVMPACY